MSGVFVVQGKLGGGKTLYGVDKLVNAIQDGRKCASNVDLYLTQFTGRNSSKTYYRLPDKPTKFDLECLGRGCAVGTSEDKFGILLLDECAHWFNARNWQDSSNQELIQYLLYIRKLGWEVYLLIQDESALDKQARKLFAEHVVTCRRTDRMRIPFVSFVLRYLHINVNMFKMHVATIRYGSGPGAPVVGTDIYRGFDKYNCYNTNQVFTDDYDSGVYALIPNRLRARKPKSRGFRKFMGITKIYLAKHRVTSLLLLCSIIIYAILQIYVFGPKFTKYEHMINDFERVLSEQKSQYESLEHLAESLQKARVSPGAVASVDDALLQSQNDDRFVFDSIASIGTDTNVFFRRGDDIYNSKQLVSMGYLIKDRGCSYLIQNLQNEQVFNVPSPCRN